MHELARPMAITLASLGLSLTACNVSPQPADDAPSAALEDLGEPATTPDRDRQAGPSARERSLAEAARQSADDLSALIAQGRPLSAGPAASSGSADAGRADPPWQPPSARAGGQAQPQAQPEPQPEAGNEPQTAQPQPGTQVASEPTPAAAAAEIDPIAAALDRLERDAADPDRALSAAVLAEAMRRYADRDDGSTPGQSLSPGERELFEAIAPVVQALASGERADAPQRVGGAVEDAMLELGNVLPIRIRDAALATDIYGFAAYRPFERNTFLAGRENRLLLYTEPSRFTSTPTADPASSGAASNPGAVEVQLGLELRLFNERGSMLAWRRPEERVAIRSDRPRAEIYLGTVIDLPSSLTVGQYRLKVILRDLADGSEDERVIPIQIVADPRLTSRATQDR